MQWLNKIVDEIEALHPGGDILIESGGSPSGTYHLGHLRELIISDAILRELKKRGRSAQHIYYADDLDALRKIPVNIPADYDKYLGQPLCDIPAPGEQGSSYADYFLQDLKDVAEVLKMEIEFVHTNEKYRSGFFIPAVELALEHADEIRNILENVSGHKLGEDWSPIQINEGGYLKKRRFVSLDKDAKTVTYEDKDGKQQTTPYDKGDVKLDWRVDWPARWWLLKVDAEPFGRDHATKGGSYDTGAALMEKVFDAPAPLPVPYDFVNLAGDNKKMSASKGTGLDAIGAVKVLPPEIVRFLMLRYPPSKRLYFDPENGVAQLIDEFAELIEKDPDNPVLYFSREGIEPVISRVPFSHLVASYQASLKNPEATLDILSRTGYQEVVEQNRQILIDELKYIDEWLSKWAPEDIKFELLENLQQDDFNEEEKNYLRSLGDKINEAPEGADGEWFHKAIYDIKESMNLQPQQVFKPLYRALIGKESGPRAGWFLSILPREWLVKRLRFEAFEQILQLSSVEAAPLLLGCTLSRKTPEGVLSVKIVETEAYNQSDPASHSFRGLTVRTAPMFEPGGVIYVYFTYGMHYCFNIVVGKKGAGEAVLIRAGEPTEGIEIMKKHRGIEDIHNLTNGPAKLTQALGIISTQLSGKKLDSKTLQLSVPKTPINSKHIGISPRIGIKKAVDQPWRFYLNGNTFVSR